MVGSTETLIDLLRQILEAQRETNRLLKAAADGAVRLTTVRPPPSLAIKLGASEVVVVSGRDQRPDADRDAHDATMPRPSSRFITNHPPRSGE